MPQLPIELQALIAAGIGFLVTEGLKALSSLFGKDLGGVGAAITAALVSAVVLFVNALIAIIPPEYAPVVQSVLALLVAVFGAFGVHRQVKRFMAAKK